MWRPLSLNFMRNIITLCLVLLAALQLHAEEPRIKIAISKASNTSVPNYVKWLKAAREDVEIIELGGLTPAEAANALNDVDGLLLSGGADVNPAAYMRNDLRSICEVDEERDAMEFALIKRAREMDIPILGICRGMQILNVAFGGSLIADIPSQYKTTITHTYDRENKLDSKHDVKLVSDSYMREDIGALAGRVNSAHHQCMNELAPSFRPAAHSPDGIIEALEWNESLRASKPFLFAVQWHPERLSYDNPMSLTIAKRFLSEVLVSKKTKK